MIDLENISTNKLIKSKYEVLVKKYQDLNAKFGKNQSKNYTKL